MEFLQLHNAICVFVCYTDFPLKHHFQFCETSTFVNQPLFGEVPYEGEKRLSPPHRTDHKYLTKEDAFEISPLLNAFGIGKINKSIVFSDTEDAKQINSEYQLIFQQAS